MRRKRRNHSPGFRAAYYDYIRTLIPVAQTFSEGQSVEECLSVQNTP